MPRKSYRKGRSMSKRYRRFGRKAGFNRRRKAKTVVHRTTVPVGLGFPRKLIMTHKYCATGSITCIAGVLTKQLFKCNGMYDPDYTGVGHQPLYFDQMNALYDHYTVIGSRIRVSFASYPGNPAYGNFRVGLMIADQGTIAPTTFDGFAEQSTSKWKMLSGSATTGTMDQRSLRSKWSAKKFFGKGVLANTDLQGTSTTDPAELSYYCLGAEAISDTVNESVQYTIEIDYIVVWKEIKSIQSS